MRYKFVPSKSRCVSPTTIKRRRSLRPTNHLPMALSALSSYDRRHIPFLLGFEGRSSSDLDFFGDAGEAVLRLSGICICCGEAQVASRFAAWVRDFLGRRAALPPRVVALVSEFLNESLAARAQDRACIRLLVERGLGLPSAVVSFVFDYCCHISEP